MKEFNKWFTMLGVAAAMFVAGSAHATNGYFTHGIGTAVTNLRIAWQMAMAAPLQSVRMTSIATVSTS
jgi:hypothetical protein